jgi:hypothetical protein
MLYQQGVIDEVLYSSLSKARFARNDFIHKGLTPSYEDANSALMSLIILVEESSKLNEVSFNRGNLEQYLSKQSSTCIPQTFVTPKKSNKSLDVQYWREIKVIPGDKNWEGDFESYPDISLSPLEVEPET